MDDALEQVPLFAGLNDAAFEDLRNIARPFAVARGETLFRQGDPPTGLFVVEQGLLEIATRMPGDEAAYVSRIAPGEVVGEFAMLDDAPRSATVTAVEDTTGMLILTPSFAAMLAEGRPGAVAAVDRLRGLVASRTRATLERLAQTSVAEPWELRAAASPYAANSETVEFDTFRALMAYAPLGDEGGANLLADGETLAAPRGSSLVAAGTPPDHAVLVLRGAVRAAFARGDRLEQVSIHGPGEWAGLVATIDRRAHPLALSAAEDSLLFRVPSETFARWRLEPGTIGRAVLGAVDRQLVRDQRRANRHLGRAIALERFNAQARAA